MSDFWLKIPLRNLPPERPKNPELPILPEPPITPESEIINLAQPELVDINSSDDSITIICDIPPEIPYKVDLLGDPNIPPPLILEI